MKKLFTIIAVLFCLSSHAQINTTIRSEKDTILFKPGSIQIQPVVVDVKGSQAYSISWTIFGLGSDTSYGATAYVVLHDKKGKQVADFNQPIPSSITNLWLDNKVIDDYILLMNPRFIKYVPIISTTKVNTSNNIVN